LDSYVANDNELGPEADSGPVHDDWGGSQYDSGSEEPLHASADLAELTDSLDIEEARLGTMRYQYFSMRIPTYDDLITTPALELVSNLPPSLRHSSGFHATARRDCEAISTHWRQQGLRALTYAEEERIITELRNAHHYSNDPILQFDVLAAEFETRHGDSPWSRSTEDVWQSLLQLQLAEHIRNIQMLTSLESLALTPEPSAQQLALMNVDKLRTIMDSQLAGDIARDMLYGNLTYLNQQSRDDANRVRELLQSPRSSQSEARAILDTALDMLDSSMHTTAQFLRSVGDRRTMSTEFMLRLRYEHSLRSGLRGALVGPMVPPPGVASILLVSIPDSDSEDEARNESGSEGESPPSIGSTPPPSYPGTPEHSGSEDDEAGLWSEMSTPDPDIIDLPPGTIIPAPPSSFLEVPTVGTPSGSTPPDAPSASFRTMRIIIDDDEELADLPSLSIDHPYILQAETDFIERGESSPILATLIEEAHA
jgi:hypothetical protein